jgi:signal transduction histidine kinase
MAHYLTWPLAILKRAMTDVALGRFETRVKLRMGKRRDEIVDLSEDCDRMAKQLKLLVESQQNLLYEISHELRSPLTRMRVAISLLQLDHGHTDLLDRIERESKRMDALIGALLTLARAHGRLQSIRRSPVDVMELLALAIDNAQFEAEAKESRIAFERCSAFITRANEELLYRCFENILRNAVRYTNPNTAILVSTEINHEDNQLTVLITDHGPGVEESRLATIFQPFERGERDSTVGFGLGLAIASRAVSIHDGSISASNTPPHGLTVKISLPRTE